MKNLSNKTKYIIFAIIMAVITLVSILFQVKRYGSNGRTEEVNTVKAEIEKPVDESNTNEPITNNNSYTSTYYSDGTEDSDYSYIENSSVMQDFSSSLPYRAIITIGDEVNTFLKQNGITGTRVYIKSIDEIKNDDMFVFRIRTIDETTEFEAKYNTLSCTWDIGMTNESN